jgi:hypothetical protein
VVTIEARGEKSKTSGNLQIVFPFMNHGTRRGFDRHRQLVELNLVAFEDANSDVVQ